MSLEGVWEAEESTCGNSERQSLLPCHPVNHRSVCKVFLENVQLVSEGLCEHFKEGGGAGRCYETTSLQRRRGSSFLLSECDDTVMHHA